MKAFVTLPRGAVFDTFFTPENIALAESLGEIVWNETDRHLTPDEIPALVNADEEIPQQAIVSAFRKYTK